MIIKWHSGTTDTFDYIIGGYVHEATDPAINVYKGVTLEILSSIVPPSAPVKSGSWTKFVFPGTYLSGPRRGDNMGDPTWEPGDVIMTGKLTGSVAAQQNDASVTCKSAKCGVPFIDELPFVYGQMFFGAQTIPAP